MLKKLIGTSALFTYTAALLSAISARADCGGSGVVTVTNLPALPNYGYQVNGLNSAGQLTGYFFNDSTSGEAFIYDNAGLHDLGNLGGYFSQGRAINSSGTVVGDSMEPSGESHAALYSGGTVVDLGTLGGSSASAGLVNDAGQIAGTSFLTGDGQMEPFIYKDGTLTALGGFGGSFGVAFGLNNPGFVVGESSTETGSVHAFVYTNGPIQDLGTLGGDYAAAFAINDSGLIVGESSVPSGDTHAFVYSGGVMTDLGGGGGGYSSAFLLNRSNQVAGYGLDAVGVFHGFLYANGTLQDLGTLGSDTYPDAMNNLGQVVGQSRVGDGSFHAFLWQNGNMTDLNSIIPTNSGWVLEDATLINDAGRIVGLGQLDGAEQWFVLDLGGSSDRAPIAVAGADQTVGCGTQVTLDGSQSSDPDGDALSYQWSSAGSILGTNVTLSGFFISGTNVVTLKVSDPCGKFSEASVTVVVKDTVPPTIHAPHEVTLATDGNCQAVVPDLSGQVTVSDCCVPASSLQLTQSLAAGTVLGPGHYRLKVTVTDPSGNSASANVTLKVVDTTAPTIVSFSGPLTVSVDNSCQAAVPNVVSSLVAVDNCTAAADLVITQNPAAGTMVGKGQHNIHVVVKDASGNKATVDIALTVADTTAPTISSAPGPVTVSVKNNCQGLVPNVLGSIVASDNCTPANRLVMTQNPAAGTSVDKGQHTIQVTVTDAAGNQASVDVLLNVVDTTAPVIHSLSVNPNVISPPNNKMVPVTVSVSATDNCDGAPASKIISITCNEAVGAGDIQITGPLTASVVATRNGGGGGRIYTITVQCSDSSGNKSQATVTVTVPQGKK